MAASQKIANLFAFSFDLHYLCSRDGRKEAIHHQRTERRRYYEGIDNLFRIYMPIVDTWVLIDNSVTPRSIVATGGCGQVTDIRNEITFKNIEANVKH